MNKKENILNAALELLVTKGVHNTPMSEVAKKAGTGMGTIYNYFPNKEALINEIYIGIKEQEETLFLKVNTDATIKKQFVDCLKVIINFFIHNPSYFNFLQQLEASPIITKENKVKGQKSVEIVVSLLEKGKLNKIIKNISTQEILVFIGGGISSYLKQNLNNSEKATTSLKNHIQMIWDGIKE